MTEITMSKISSLKDTIYTIRGKQVMLDRDLAELYEVDLKRLNEQVKRNNERFPQDFCFQLKKDEFDSLRSQIATIEIGKGKHTKYLPNVFTQEGVASLSGVLNSKKAIQVNIQIMRAFIQMRHFMAKNASILQRLDKVELKQLEHNKHFNQIFKAIESKQLTPKQGVFYDGELFDAFVFTSDLIKKAKKKIVLIDNYVSEETLLLLSSKNKSAKITIYTKIISPQLKLAKDKFNSQYGNLDILIFNRSHDRFLIIDDEMYLIGASIKDLGKKWFGFFKVEDDTIIKKITSELASSK